MKKRSPASKLWSWKEKAPELEPEKFHFHDGYTALSKCSNCYGPHTFEGPQSFVSVVFYYIQC